MRLTQPLAKLNPEARAFIMSLLSRRGAGRKSRNPVGMAAPAKWSGQGLPGYMAAPPPSGRVPMPTPGLPPGNGLPPNNMGPGAALPPPGPPPNASGYVPVPNQPGLWWDVANQQYVDSEWNPI